MWVTSEYRVGVVHTIAAAICVLQRFRRRVHIRHIQKLYYWIVSERMRVPGWLTVVLRMILSSKCCDISTI